MVAASASSRAMPPMISSEAGYPIGRGWSFRLVGTLCGDWVATQNKEKVWSERSRDDQPMTVIDRSRSGF